MGAHSVTPLVLDAQNRAWRTFMQGLGVDVLGALALTVYTVLSGPDPVVWTVFGALLAKTFGTSVASYVMRRFLDPSRFPTALPPKPAAAPAVEYVMQAPPNPGPQAPDQVPPPS